MAKLSCLVVAVLVLPGASPARAYDGTCRTLQDVQELPPRHWCRVQDSHCRAVEKQPEEWPDWNGAASASYDSYQRNMGFRAIMTNWCGAAYDSSRDRLLVFGGGHNGYGGNEIVAFDLQTLSWIRLSDPTAYPNRSPEFQNSDGTPVSRHTYGQLEYIVHADRLFAFSGAPDAASGGCGVQGTWTFDLAARETAGAYSPDQWELRTDVDEPAPRCEDNSVYDAQTGRVYHHHGTTPSGWSYYDFDADTWTQLNAIGVGGGVRTVIPGDRRFIVEFGNGHYDGYARWDLESAGLEKTVVSTTGARAMESAGSPGAAYDPVVDKIIAWDGGTTVYALDVDANEWIEHPAAPENLADPGTVDASGGTYGRFRYSENLNVYVTVDDVDEDVFLYRFAPTEIDTLPPAPPEDLQAQ